MTLSSKGIVAIYRRVAIGLCNQPNRLSGGSAKVEVGGDETVAGAVSTPVQPAIFSSTVGADQKSYVCITPVGPNNLDDQRPSRLRSHSIIERTLRSDMPYACARTCSGKKS